MTSSSECVHKLVSWYKIAQRRLPWRETNDPYRVWVSETMLQQTRVETVIPYYHEFLRAFPTIGDLAAADQETVLKHWQGLGYYSRVKNLHKAARVVVDEHRGEVPTTREVFSTLPGVGPYTCGAVLSIAFNQPIPAVDGNVLRVMTRFLAHGEPIESAATKRRISDQVALWLSHDAPSVITQALMELGALVCTPKQPRCEDCPLQSHCAAKREGLQASLPVRLPKRERRKRAIGALWLSTEEGLWMERRPDAGLLGGLWQLPSVELEHVEGLTDEELWQAAVLRFLEQEEARLEVHEQKRDYVVLSELRHIFTHIEWDVRVFRPVGMDAIRGRIKEGSHLKLIPFSEIHRLPVSRVYERALEEMLSFDSHPRHASKAPTTVLHHTQGE